jgi:hypothetical protein
MSTEPTFLSKILAFLAIDFLIVVASWYIPADMTLMRNLAAAVQLIFLTATAWVTIQFIVEDF